MDRSWSGPRYDRWENRTQRPLLVLSVLLIPVLVIPEVRTISPRTRSLLDAVDYCVWAAFVVDYGTRLFIAQSRRSFVRHNVPDLLLVVLPMLRPLRAARLLRLLRLGRLAVLLRVIARQRSVQTRALAYVVTAAAGSALLAAVAMDDLERNSPTATIHSFGDSIWWAFTTVSTVGYGDRYPVTTGGRFVAAALMVVGVSLFGVITASIATYFVRNVRQTEEDTTGNEMAARLVRVERLLEQLSEQQLAARGEPASGPQTTKSAPPGP